MKTEELIKTLLTKLDSPEQKLAREIINIGYIDYLFEFRYLAMRLPRRSGKSTALYKLHTSTSSLLLVPHQGLIDNHIQRSNGVHSFSSLDDLDNRFRGKYSLGLKYRCILIDEYQMLTPKHIDSLIHLIHTLKAGNSLEEDFYMLGLGT